MLIFIFLKIDGQIVQYAREVSGSLEIEFSLLYTCERLKCYGLWLRYCYEGLFAH